MPAESTRKELQDKLKSTSPEVKETIQKILDEFKAGDQSSTFNDLLLADYKEIPVDIDTFIDDDRYMGQAWKDKKTGKSLLYPYWRKRLHELFPDNLTTSVNNFIATGSRGLGKTRICILIMCYILYRCMCLKDVLDYYSLRPTEKLVFAIMNIKLDLAEEVAQDEFQKAVQLSPWFTDRGTITGTRYKTWKPNNEYHVEIKIGSQSSDVLGLPVYFCLDGDTIIATDEGNKKIKDCVDKEIKVFSKDAAGNTILSDSCTVKPTIKTKEEYQIELENGDIIKCTANHRFMLKDGTYKEAQYLTEEDELLEYVPYGYIYKTTNIKNNKIIKSIKKVELEEEKQYYDVINANPYNNFLIQTSTGYICSHNCFCDEINFVRNQNIDRQKEIAIDIIDTAVGGMKTRFIRHGNNPTMLCLASSKRSEQSFLESYVKTKLANENENVLIVDEPVWNVQPKENFSKKTFRVAIGNKFLVSKILDAGESEADYVEQGYENIIHPPIDFKHDFEEDMDRALCDFAGISSTELNKYIGGTALRDCYTNRQNPFVKDVIEVGLDDDLQYSDFFDMKRVDKRWMNKPLFIHLDMSSAGDMTGIAGVWIIGKNPSKDANKQDKDLYFELAFSVSIKAPKGHQIGYNKHRIFINWLRNQGFKIKMISTDQFQSTDIRQELSRQGFNTTLLSVDRTEPSSRICLPYQYFRSTIYEKRIDLYHSQRLEQEIINLERNINNGKVDHPPGGCFTGDTKVFLCDRSITFKELLDEFNNGVENHILSVNRENHKIQVDKIVKVCLTKQNAEIIQVELNNGEKIKCTPEHRFMLTDEYYCEAQNLEVGQELKSLTVEGNKIVSRNNIYKVVKVTKLNEREDVYDLTTELNHNFLLTSGVFVHNSKDVSDACCGALYTASQHAEEYGYNYGEGMREEDLNTMVDVNLGDNQALSIEQLNKQFEEQLKAMNPEVIKNNYNNGQKIEDENQPKAYIKDGNMLIW